MIRALLFVALLCVTPLVAGAAELISPKQLNVGSGVQAALAQGTNNLSVSPSLLIANNGVLASGLTAPNLVFTGAAFWPVSGTPFSNGAGSPSCSTQFGNSFTTLEICSAPTAPFAIGSRSAFSVISNPVGSATVGQPYADYAAQFSITKQSYLTSSVAGELSALQLTAWQGAKDDVSTLEATAVKVRGTGFDEGGVIGLGDIAASWVDPSGVNQWEVHSIISYGASVGDPIGAGAGYGISTESWLGTPYAAYVVNTLNAYGGTHAFTRAFAAGHDRSLSDIYFQIAGDAPYSGSLQPGDITQGYPGFTVTSHVDASGNWCLLNDGLSACHIAISAPFVSALTIYHPVAIEPPAGNNVGLVINQTPTGSTGLTYWNQINMSGDTSPCLFCVDFYDQHELGGAALRGAKVGFLGLLYQTSANTGTGVTAIVGIEGIGSTNTGDGGTALNAGGVAGTYFGANVIARNSGVNVLEVAGIESDVMTSNVAGGASQDSSAWYTFGYTAVNYEAVQGASLDAAYAVYSGGSVGVDHGGGPWGPGVGFHCGLCFAELSSNGLVPLDSGATVLGSHLESLSTISVAYGVDLRGFTFSQDAFISTGFSVSPSGALVAASFKAGSSAGVSCSGTFSSSAASVNGIITHC